MKILSLKLIAYGPFTDTSLDFSEEGGGFHVIYGPNEAGKSTALTALRRLLFGFPVQTSAGFLHPLPNLRIGGRLINSNGDVIEFVRRKGRVKTLRDAEDQEALGEDALDPFLGGMRQDVFEQMFAIGHEEMVAGGEEIVKGAGSVGEALFAAGAGLIKLQGVRQSLDEECKKYFLKSGKKPIINHTLADIRVAHKAQKEALLLARTWKLHHGALQKAQQLLQETRQKLTNLKQESTRLERMGKALPHIARLKEVEAGLAEYKGVPQLPADFTEKRRQAANDLEIASKDLERINTSIQRLQEKGGKIYVPENFIKHSGLIESLQHELGGYRKAQKDRPGLVARMQTLLRQVDEKLSETSFGGTAEKDQDLKLPPSVINEIQELHKAFERLTTLRETGNARLQKLEARLGALDIQRKETPHPMDVSTLKTAVQTAQKAGPIEKQYAEILLSMENRAETMGRLLKRLQLWAGDTEALDTIPLPSKESVNQFEKDFAAVRRRIEKLQAELDATTSESMRVQAELEAVELSQNVPSEPDLEKARSNRGEGWLLVRSELEGNPLPAEDLETFTKQYDGELALPDAFEKSVDQADHIADRLRREAEQVSRKGVLESRKHQLQETLQTKATILEEARSELSGIQEAWKQCWITSGVDPLTPGEMRQWLADVAAIRDKIADNRSEKRRAEAIAAEISSLKTQLIEALSQSGQHPDEKVLLASLIESGSNHAASQDEIKSRIEKIDTELISRGKEGEEVEAALADVDTKLDQWKAQWAACMETIKIAPDAKPAAAVMIIENMRGAKTLADEADVLKKRIAGIDRDAEAFTHQVIHMTGMLAPELSEESPERAAMQLNARLTAARELLAEKKGVETQLESALTDQQNAEKRVADARTRLDSLCREAGCQGLDALIEVEKRSREQQQLVLEKENAESRLRDLSAGVTVEAFIAEAGLVEPDSIVPELDRITEEIGTLEKERSDLDQTIGTEKNELAYMDGGAKAAEIAEEKQRLLAKLEAEVEHYARFKIASVLLTRTIEQYRDKHQGPLIKRASELFSAMTAESFYGIRAEYEDGDPVLMGIRSGDNKTVPVAGMSDGTADQLYLALRLASLEQYLSRNEPLPFIVDDILLRFDDDRAMGTLKILAELSQWTQVIFFTHHQHLVELANNSLGANVLKQHELKCN